MHCDVMNIIIYDQSTLPTMAVTGKESEKERNEIKMIFLFFE